MLAIKVLKIKIKSLLESYETMVEVYNKIVPGITSLIFRKY